MAAGNNIKVGVTVTVFGVLLAGVLLWLSQFDPGKKSYNIQGNFTNVGGLIPGSKVYLMGVEIGKVSATVPESKSVKVLMDIDENVKIPKSTRLVIAAKGLVGDKSVEFFINPEVEPTSFYPPGAVIAGNSPASFDDIIIEGRKIMQKANALVGDPTLNKNIRLTSNNIELFTRKLNDSLKQIETVSNSVKDISSSANALLAKTSVIIDDADYFIRDIRGITNSNSGNVTNIIASTNRLAASLEKTSRTINELLDDPTNRKTFGSTTASLRKTAENIEAISKEATMISADIRNLTSDKDLKSNLKDIVNNTRVISNTFANTLSSTDKVIKDAKDKKDRLNLEFKSEIFGKLNYQFGGTSTATYDVIGNFNILAHTGFERFPFLQLGIEELGARNQFNLQAGFYPFDNTRARVGIVRGKLGFGANYFIRGTNTEVLADAYDISSPHIRLGLNQNIYKDFGVSLYWDDQFLINSNEFAIGIRWQPSIF